MTPEGWTETDNRLCREFEFANFSEAWAFLSRVALAAERADHHPEIHNVWNRVRLELTSHDSGNTITERDLKLAERINRIAPPA